MKVENRLEKVENIMKSINMNTESERGTVYKLLRINYSDTISNNTALFFKYDIFWANVKLLRTHTKK